MSRDFRLGQQEHDLLRHIKNVLLQQGKSPSVRGLMGVMGYKSPRSISILLERLTKSGFVKRRQNGQLVLCKNPESFKAGANTIDIPLVGNVACGTPFFAHQNIESYFPVSTDLARPPYKYFMLRARGDSMDKVGIKDGNLVLVRQQEHANNNDIVVALIDTEATIKKFRKTGSVVMLMPGSSNKEHRPIIVQNDFHIQGKVVKVIGSVK